MGGVYMSFWEDVSAGAKEAAAFTAKKTVELTAIAKLKVAIKGEEMRLSKCFQAMGKLYYKSMKNDEDNAEKLLELVGVADGIGLKIASLKKELAEVQDSVVCPCCGERCKADYEFCPKCGHKAEKESNEKAEDSEE